MALKDKLLQAAAIGAAFAATFAGPRMNADQQQDVPLSSDAITAHVNRLGAFTPQGKQADDSLKFSLMGVDIDTAKFNKEQQRNPDLKNVGLIQTDKELGISIKNAETGQTYQIFADRDQIMKFSKNPDKDPSSLDVTMGVLEKDGTSRSMDRDDAKQVADCFVDTLYKLDSAGLADANGILAKAADCSRWTIKATPKGIISGKMAGQLADAIDVCKAKRMQHVYMHVGEFMTAVNRHGSR